MASAKLQWQLLLVAITATFSMAASAGLRDSFAAKKITDNDKTTNSKEVYRFTFNDEDDGSRVEIGTIVNPGTEKEELVVMGSYTVFDKETNLVTVTIYTADRNGYKARYIIRQKPYETTRTPPTPTPKRRPTIPPTRAIRPAALKNLAIVPIKPPPGPLSI